MSASGKRSVIGVTLGDPAGIGPEVVSAALTSGRLDDGFDYQVLGSIPDNIVPGQPSAESACAAWQALEEAARGALHGEFAAVVTAPVCKASLYKIGFRYPGQTEFFADRCGSSNYAMLLTGGSLTVALLTTHLPLTAALQQINRAEIVRVGILLADFLSLRLGRAPRIAIAGLNPHAGENGTLGCEEIDHIRPAVEELAQRDSQASAIFIGPISPDTVFFRRRPVSGTAWSACTTIKV